MRQCIAWQLVIGVSVVPLFALRPGPVEAQSYGGAQDAARRAAEQASQERARAAASQLELDRQRQQREQAELQRRSTSPSPGTSSTSGPTTPGSSGSSSPQAGREQPLLTLPDYSRWEKGSAYRAKVSMNPPPGRGVLGDWQYEVEHGPTGQYTFGRISTTARDDKRSVTVKIAVSCDLRNRVAEERDGTVYGPLTVEVDHRLVSQGRVPSGISLSDRRGGQRYYELKWERSAELSRAREIRFQSLSSQLQHSVQDGGLRVTVSEGGGVGRSGTFERGVLKADAVASDSGFQQAFEKLAPCWDANAWWDWPVAKAPGSAARQPGTAPVPSGSATSATPQGMTPASVPPSTGSASVAPVIPPPVQTYPLRPEKQNDATLIRQAISKPSPVYCIEGTCLGDGSAQMQGFEWKPIHKNSVPDLIAAARQLETAGMRCRAGRNYDGSRPLVGGGWLQVHTAYRPGASPLYVQRLEVGYPGPMTDEQRMELLHRLKERWPALQGDTKTWQSPLRDPEARIGVVLMRSYLDWDIQTKYTDGVVLSMLIATDAGEIDRYLLATQPGCPPGIDWR